MGHFSLSFLNILFKHGHCENIFLWGSQSRHWTSPTLVIQWINRLAVMVWQWYPKWKCIQTPEKSYAAIQLCHPLSAIPAISFCLLQPLFLLGTNANLQHSCFPVPTVLPWFASTKKQITRSTFETFNCQCEKNTNLLVKNGKKNKSSNFMSPFLNNFVFFQGSYTTPTVVTYPSIHHHPPSHHHHPPISWEP